MRRAGAVVTAVTLLCGACAFAASTTTWEMNSYQDFVRGRFSGISLDRDGRMRFQIAIGIRECDRAVCSDRVARQRHPVPRFGGTLQQPKVMGLQVIVDDDSTPPLGGLVRQVRWRFRGDCLGERHRLGRDNGKSRG